MVAQTTVSSKGLEAAEAGRLVLAGSESLKRFRQLAGSSSWNETMFSYETWLGRGCIAVVVLAVLYFLPAVIGAWWK